MELKQRMNTLGELGVFLWEQKMWWMIPLFGLILLLAVLLLLAQSSAVAPWMYPL